MRRVLPVLALALLLAAPAVQAASPGARSPITIEGAATDVAIASNGRFAASNNDPGSITTTPDEPVWHLWNADNSVKQDGNVDPGTCTDFPPTDDCQTHATHIAVSSDGRRIATAGAVNNQLSVLVLSTDLGVETRVEVEWRILDLAMSDDGSRVAIVGSAVVVPQEPVGRLAVYSSSGVEQYEVELQAAAVDVDMDPSGNRIVVAAGGHHRFSATSSDASPNSAVSGVALAVDLAGNSGLWSIAGYDSGYFALFSDSNPTVQEYRRRDETSPIRAVALRNDGSAFALGNDAGTLWLYGLDTGAADPVALLATSTGLGALGDLEFSGDGRYLVAKTGGSVRLFHTSEGKLTEVWKDDRASLAPSVAIDTRGEHVVAGAASSVIVYDAVHKLTAGLPAATHRSGRTENYTVTFRNDGNRAEAVSLSQSPPSGVIADATPSQFTVAPGATQSVKLTVTVPATRAPGPLAIQIQQRLNGGADGTPTSTVTLTVPTEHNLLYVAQGASSLAVQPGGFATFPVLLTNAGNVQETVALALSGAPADWDATVDPASLTLAPGQSMLANASLGAPAGAAQLAQAQVTLLSGGASTGLDFTATVGAEFKVRLAAPPGAVLTAGTSGLVNLTVTNDGNAPDSFTVRVLALPAGWQGGFLTGLSEQRVEDLGAGQSRVVQLGLRAPETAVSPVPVQVTVSAASLGDPSKVTSRPVLVTVVSSTTTSSSSDSETGGGGDNGIPGPGLLLALLAVGLAGLAARRRVR